MLEKRNSIHPSHDRDLYLKDIKHYVFTFQDATLECVVTEGEFWPTQITLAATKGEAEKAWHLNAE